MSYEQFLDVTCQIDEYGGLPPSMWPILTKALANDDQERIDRIVEWARMRAKWLPAK